MVDYNYNEYRGIGIYCIEYTMEYCTILVSYVRKRFGLVYNNDLMKCLYIIYDI